MNNKLQSILHISVAVIYIFLIYRITNTDKANNRIKIQKSAEKEFLTDTIESIKSKKILFIGDSHSANNTYGWQKILCQKTGAIEKNLSIGGKTTGWMVSRLKENIDTSYTYCFIWGGGNDMYNGVRIERVIANLNEMIKICEINGIKAVVLTGINVRECVEPGKRLQYVDRCEELQTKIKDSIQGVKVVENHFVSRNDGDCADFICHMNKKGHVKMASGIISEMKFKIN